MVYSVLGLSAVLALSIFFFALPNAITLENWHEPQSLLILAVSIIILALGCLPLLKMRKIHITPQRIIFKKQLFSSSIKEVHFKSYDCYKTIYEETENDGYEAVWLIKDKKIADSFSSYQYSNYKKLKAALNLKYEGELDFSPIKQLQCKLGARIS